MVDDSKILSLVRRVYPSFLEGLGPKVEIGGRQAVADGSFTDLESVLPHRGTVLRDS